MKSPAQILVSGYYGCGNAGDEAVLAGIKSSFKTIEGEKIELTVLSQNPTSTTAQHNLPAIYRMDRMQVRKALKNTNLLISGGGSLLQDTSSLRSLLYYIWVIRTALSLNVPVMFYAQGIGPLRRKISRALVRNVANRAAYLTVRDEASARILHDIGVVNPNLEVTADPAFCLKPVSSERVQTLFHEEQIPTYKPLIGVSLRSWSEAGKTASAAHYSQLLDELENQSSAQTILIPMQIPQDLVIADQIAAMRHGTLILRNHHTPEELLGVIGAMESVIAMRLHTLIFAAGMKTPSFALSYDPKVDNLMNQLHMSDYKTHWRDFNPAGIASRIQQLTNSWPERKPTFTELIYSLENKALRNAEIAVGIVE